MSNYRERKSVVALGEAMDSAMGKGVVPSVSKKYPLRSTGRCCAGCGREVLEILIDGEWAEANCLTCAPRRLKEEFIAETLQAQAEKSRTLYSGASFDNFRTDAEYQTRGWEAAHSFYEHVTKRVPTAIVFFSHPTGAHTGYGTGKTHLASAISNKLREDGWSILSWLAPELFSEIKGTYDKDADQTEWQIIRMATECDLLVLDDVGKEHVRETNRSWHHDLYYRIINARYQRGPLIVTTNLDAADLPHHIGGASFSRLWEMCGGNERIVKMCGPDYRFIDKEK
jgi:DNA replication protein DnaC